MALRRPAPRIIVPVVVVLVVTSAAVFFLGKARASSDAVHTAAERYVGYIAAGTKDDAQRLWAMHTSESPGALRTATDLLASAPERIEVVSVGEAEETDRPDVPYSVELDDFHSIEVHYRLAGKEHDRTIVLGRLQGESGTDVGDWRVVTPLTGSVDWQAAPPVSSGRDLFVGETRLVRRPMSVGGSDEVVQPLFPAVYRLQARIDPYFVSSPEQLAVTAGDPVAAPELVPDPTPRTRKRIRRQVLDTFDSCRFASSFTCPFTDLVESEGVETWQESWWRGVTRMPRIVIGPDTITLTGGAFAFVGPAGRQTMRFSGTGTYGFDTSSWKPAVHELEITEVSR